VNSGGTSSPRAAVAARETSGHGGSGMASSLLPFLADGDLQKQEKNTTGSRFFFPCFKICISLVFLWVSSSSPLLRVAVSKKEAWDPVASLQAVL
jgi:hypothetical protein